MHEAGYAIPDTRQIQPLERSDSLIPLSEIRNPNSSDNAAAVPQIQNHYHVSRSPCLFL